MMNHPYKAVLFDLDDTLIDSYLAYRKTYEYYSGLEPEIYRPGNEEEIQDIYFYAFRPFLSKHEITFTELQKKWGIRNAPCTGLEFRLSWGDKYTSLVEAYPWTREVLGYLHKKKIRTALLTNGSFESQSRKLVFSELYNEFEEIIISESTGIEKPDPAIFHMLAKRLRLSVKDCLFVGDTVITDIDGAKAAGMDCLWLTKSDNSAGATFTSPDIRFLKTIV